MPRLYSAPIATLCLVLFAGCPLGDLDLDLRNIGVKEPLVSPKNAKAPERLIGTYWHNDQIFPMFDEDVDLDAEDFEADFLEESDLEFESIESVLHIGRAGGKMPAGFLRAVYVSIDESGDMSIDRFVFFTKQLAEDRFVAHFPILNDESFVDITSWDVDKCTGYVVMECQIKAESIGLRYLNLKEIFRLADSKKIEMTDSNNHRLLPPDAVDRLMRANSLFTTPAAGYDERFFRLKLETPAE